MKEKNEEKQFRYSASIHETAGGTPRPSLFRNYISYFGLAIVGASVTSFILLAADRIYQSPAKIPTRA